MNTLTHLLPEKLVTALGWTFLHSLWQGALVALLAGMSLILLKKHSAAVRYFLTLTALVTVFVLAVVTFQSYYVVPAAAQGNAQDRAGTTVRVAVQSMEATGTSTLHAALVSFTSYFTKHFPLLVVMWGVGVLVLLLRLIGSLSYVARLTHYQVALAGDPWQQKVTRLGQNMGLRRAVTLLESGLAKVPMTVGYLKPVILLPVGAISGLSPAQVEAVLAHELAHIHRHDYLVNLVQSLLEIVLFYHPAVWWLSARVREEREHCCDDLAVSSCSDSITFARALMHLEERYGQTPATALAVNGPDGMLLGRIKRLLAQPRRTPTFVEGFIAALVLLAGAAVVSVSASTKVNENTSIKMLKEPNTGGPAAISQKNPQETIVAGRSAVYLQWTDSTDRRSDVIIVKDKRGNIVELYVDGRRIPDKELKNYRGRISQALAEQQKDHYSNAPEQDVNSALRRIEERNDKGERWSISGDLEYTPPPPPVPLVAPVPAVPPVPPLPYLGEWDDEHMELEEGFRSVMENLQITMQDLQESMHTLDSDYRQQQQDLVDELRKLHEEMGGVDKSNKKNKEWENLEKELSDLERKLEKLGYTHAESRADVEKQMRKTEAEMNKKQGEIQRSLQRQQQEMQRHNSEMTTEADAEHEANMREHAEQMKDHEAQMQIHEAEMKKHDAFLKVLNDQLQKDGLLERNGNVDFRMENGQLYINEQLQPVEVYGKYLKLFEEKGVGQFKKKPGDQRFRFHWKRD